MLTYKEFISENDIKNFLNFSKEGLKSFRYFSKRPTNIVKTHVYNIIHYQDLMPASYGHLDLDDEFKLWLGILVSDNYRGRGFGKKTMESLLLRFTNINYKKLYLSVDSDNEPAISLYKKFNFNLLEKKENVLYYVLEKE